MTAPAISHQNRPSASGVTHGGRQTQLLESLISDFQWTVLHAAALHYLTRAASQERRDLALESCRHLLHDTTGIAGLALRYAQAIGLDSAAEAALSTFYAHFAQALSTTLNALRRQGSREPIPAVSVPALVPCWKTCCDSALQAVAAVDLVTRARLVPEYAQNAVILAGFTQEGARGQTDRLGPRGDLALPKLAQRRRHVRAPRYEPCTILYAGGSVPAVLRNASVDGLGLTCSAPLSSGDPVTLVLRGGRRLSATVIRRDGEVCGLRLDRPLSSTDRLLAE